MPRLRSAPAVGPVILMYHQVADLVSDPWGLAVSPRNFEQQMQVLAEKRQPVPLARLTSEIGGAPLDPRQVVVTFDDGYLDNLVNAKPILERYDVPGTVFVVGDAVGLEREFWWDELDRLLLGGHPLPRVLQLRIAGREQRWLLKTGEKDAGFGSRRAWSRQRLHRLLWRRLRMMPGKARWEVLEALREWSGQPAMVRPDRRVMSEGEVRQLASGGLVEIGAHTASHPRLSALPPREQLADIQRGKERLEAIIAAPVTSFSYPFGGRLDVSPASVAAVREAGFARACTTTKGVVRPGADPLRLPRLYVGNWPAEEFERQLAPWLETA